MARTVLIVDDHPSFRATARALLEADGFEVVGEARDGREIEARGVLRPHPQRDQACEDERDPRGHGQRSGEHLVGLVVACMDQQDSRDHLRGEHRDHERQLDCTPTQGSSARTAAPDSSPFGTNPHAPHSAI